MKQIKTIIKRRDYADTFDQAVNLAIAEGWTLVRRYIDQGSVAAGASVIFQPVFVAELEREVPDEGL